VAQAARQIAQLVLRACEAAPVWVAAGTADAMAADAQLLTCATVTAGARAWIDARLNAVHPAAAAGREPSQWVRTARTGARRDARFLVALDTRVFAVAGCAKARLRARFFGVTRSESRTVESR
jgi:hypothetical protein